MPEGTAKGTCQKYIVNPNLASHVAIFILGWVRWTTAGQQRMRKGKLVSGPGHAASPCRKGAQKPHGWPQKARIAGIGTVGHAYDKAKQHLETGLAVFMERGNFDPKDMDNNASVESYDLLDSILQVQVTCRHRWRRLQLVNDDDVDSLCALELVPE